MAHTIIRRVAMATLGFAVCEAPAHAQDDVDSTPRLEVVVVTAQRRSESLQDVPIAISALDARTLREGGYVDVEDLSGQVPNLQVSALWGTSAPKIFMRGVGNNNFNQTAESKVASYVDQVYLGAPSGQLFQMFDLERVEVLRGPQGTLYGKNATGGAISVASRTPTAIPGGYARLGFGNYDAIEAEAAINVPLSDTVQTRTAATYRKRDGYVTDLGTNEKVNDADQWAARSIWRFKPSDDLEVLLNVHGGASSSTHNNSTHRGLFDPAALALGQTVRLPSAQIIAGGGVDILGYRDPNADPYVNTYGTPTFADIDLFGTSLLANIGLGDYTLTSITGYERSKRHVLQEGNGAPSTIFTIDWGPSDFQQLSQELRITSPDDARFKWVAGLFVFDESGEVNNFYRLTSVNFALGFDAFDQFYEQNTRDYAAFGQGTLELTDTLSLTLGARYTYEERDIDHVTYIGDENRNHILAFVDVDLEESWSEWSGRIALDYKPSASLMFFASVNRGFTTGGFNTGAFNDPVGAAEIFDPEILTSYELGMKSTLFSERVRFAATTFLYDYKDLQVFTFTPSGQQFIENASDAKASGLELELQALLTDRLEVTASAGLLRTEYENFVRGSENLSGNRMIGAPEEQFALGFRYEQPTPFGNVTARGTFTHTGHRYYDERELEEISSQGSDYNLDGSVTWTDPRERFSVSLWGKNLTDETTIIDVVDVGLFGYQNVWYNMPRTYGVTLNYDF